MSSEDYVDVYSDSGEPEEPLWSDESDDGDDIGLIDVMDERKCL